MRKKKIVNELTWEERLKTAQPSSFNYFTGTFLNTNVMDRMKMMEELREQQAIKLPFNDEN